MIHAAWRGERSPNRRYARQLLHGRSAQVRAGLADVGVSVADYELLLIVPLGPRGVVL